MQSFVYFLAVFGKTSTKYSNNFSLKINKTLSILDITQNILWNKE